MMAVNQYSLYTSIMSLEYYHYFRKRKWTFFSNVFTPILNLRTVIFFAPQKNQITQFTNILMFCIEQAAAPEPATEPQQHQHQH